MHDLIRCVDEFLSRAERERPVLVLTGCRRCGKTTALERIREQLELIGLPHTLNDYATLPMRTPELLTALMFGLNRRSVYGRLSFPRFLVGMIVMPLDLDQRDPRRARGQVQQELEKYHDTDKLRSFLDKLGGNLLMLVPHLAGTGLNDLIGALLEGLLMRGVLGSRFGRKVLLGPGIGWYAHQDRPITLDPPDVLVELNRRATGMDDDGNEANRHWVARLLWGAFLADLDASFAGHANWDRNCAVLVDNADSGGGLMFVTEFSEALDTRRANRLADPPLTVIAASREELVRRALPAGGKPVPVRDAGLADYQRRLLDHKVAKRGWYVLRLPSLTEIETRNLVAGRGRITDVHGQATDELLAPVIFQVTGGHPEATHMIVTELTGSADPADLETVLTKAAGSTLVAQPAAGGPPLVEDLLVGSLTAGLSDDAIRDLVTCSAAWVQADANRLELESGLLTGSPATRNDLFVRELWGEPMAGEPAGPGAIVMLPALRRLLLRRLASSPDDWNGVFSWLKAASAQAGHPDAELYYALALAEVDLVAQRLAARLSPQLTEDGAIGWLACWHAVTAAPRPGPAVGSRAIPRLVSWADPNDEPTASVAALVAARWLLANSLRAADLRALRREIAASLDTVARFAGAGRDAFRTQAGTYRRLTESLGGSPAMAGFTPPGEGLTRPGVSGKGHLWKKLRPRLIAGGAAVIVAVGSWQAVSLLTATCGGGTSSFQGECVGVTDGSHVFDPSLTAIETAIKNQNARARATGDYVSIALLTPLTTAPGSDVPLSRVQQQMEGAATAQAYLNGQGFKPAIRLLLANEGSQQQAWPQVVRQLQDSPADQHLVAVVGVGLSTTDTVQAARQLASGTSPLPMIGYVDTGDGLNTSGPQPPLVPSALSGRISGLVRVEPSVADEVKLLAHYYLASLPKPAGSSVPPKAALSPNAVLVYDNDPNDLYTGSLSLDFSQQFGAHIIDKKQFAPDRDRPGEFANIANDVCPPSAKSTPVVLYAGRESAFPDFIKKLSTYTNCPRDGTITVLTGADAESFDPAQTLPNPGEPTIDVVYPNIADSRQLEPWYRQAFAGSPADLSASWAIMTSDAVTAAEQAARQASQGSSTPPTPGAVTSLLYDFNKLTNPVKGATGPFVITSDGDEGCQWMPLIIDQNGTPKVLSETQPGCPAS